MASSTEPRGGLAYGWALGESGWKNGMDDNLLKLSRLCVGGLSVKRRDLSAPPSSFAAGDAFIISGTPAGVWASSSLAAQTGDVIIYDGAAWVLYEPRVGWQAYVESEQKLTVFKAGGWSTGIAI